MSTTARRRPAGPCSFAMPAPLRFSVTMRLGLTALTLWAAFLRAPGLFIIGWEPDEALFATWARLIAAGRDVWLHTTMLDKPPLLFYTQALLDATGGPPFLAAQLPNWIAGVLLTPLVGRLAWRLYRDPLVVGLAAGWMATTPALVRFSSSAFLDPFLTLWLTLAAWWMAPPGHDRLPLDRRSYFMAGLALGLAAATKYQAWLFLPLLVGLGWLGGWEWPHIKRWLVGVTLPLSWLLLWGGGSLIARQWVSHGGLRLLFSWELWPRLDAWAQTLLELVGSPVVGIGLILGLPVFLALLIHDLDRPTALDQGLVIFVLLYLALHVFLAVAVELRYLLPLTPWLGLLLGRFAARGRDFFHLPRRSWLQVGLPCLYLLIMGPAVWPARHALPPPPATAITLAASALSSAPAGTVLYDHWYSWQWRYALLEHNVYVSWFPHPAALVEDLRVFADDQRYLALPNDVRQLPVQRALAEANYHLRPVQTQPELTLYQVIRP